MTATNGVRVSGFIGGYAARLAGVSLKDFYTDFDLCIRVQQLAAELHGLDDGPSYGWADWGGWEFGGRIRFPENYLEAAPGVEVPAVETPEQVADLSVPDPATAGMYPRLHEFNRRLRALGTKAKLQSGSVTNVVAGIIGKEKLLRWYHRHPEAVRTAYEKAVDFILKAADYTIAEHGAANCHAGASYPLDANDLISRDIFERFTLPYQTRVHEGLMARGVTDFGLHICGDHRRNLEAWTRLPLPPGSTLSVGSQMDLREVAAAFGHKHVIAGNLATDLLNNGTYDEVYEAARACIEQGRDLPGGFVLMPACEMPVTTPPLNVHAMVRAARDASRS